MKKVHRGVALSVRLFGKNTKKTNRKLKMDGEVSYSVVVMVSS